MITEIFEQEKKKLDIKPVGAWFIVTIGDDEWLAANHLPTKKEGDAKPFASYQNAVQALHALRA